PLLRRWRKPDRAAYRVSGSLRQRKTLPHSALISTRAPILPQQPPHLHPKKRTSSHNESNERVSLVCVCRYVFGRILLQGVCVCVCVCVWGCGWESVSVRESCS